MAKSFHSVDSLAEQILSERHPGQRNLLGLAGPPAAGKSWLAEHLVENLARRGHSACVLPMDGFHLDNSILEARGLLSRKGSPATFDVLGFIELVKRAKQTTGDLFIPIFDRHLDRSINAGALIPQGTQFVIVEGNYLFLDEHPWNQIFELFDQRVALTADFETLRTRLIQRWLDHGHTQLEATERAMANDIPNAKTVLENSRTPDWCFES